MLVTSLLAPLEERVFAGGPVGRQRRSVNDRYAGQEAVCLAAAEPGAQILAIAVAKASIGQCADGSVRPAAIHAVADRNSAPPVEWAHRAREERNVLVEYALVTCRTVRGKIGGNGGRRCRASVRPAHFLKNRPMPDRLAVVLDLEILPARRVPVRYLLHRQLQAPERRAGRGIPVDAAQGNEVRRVII